MNLFLISGLWNEMRWEMQTSPNTTVKIHSFTQCDFSSQNLFLLPVTLPQHSIASFPSIFILLYSLPSAQPLLSTNPFKASFLLFSYVIEPGLILRIKNQPTKTAKPEIHSILQDKKPHPQAEGGKKNQTKPPYRIYSHTEFPAYNAVYRKVCLSMNVIYVCFKEK